MGRMQGRLPRARRRSFVSSCLYPRPTNTLVQWLSKRPGAQMSRRFETLPDQGAQQWRKRERPREWLPMLMAVLVLMCLYATHLSGADAQGVTIGADLIKGSR